MKLLETWLGRFRLIALLEGASFLLLLAVAMPLKYVWGMPLGVKLVGWAHGVLFMLYMVALARVAMERGWPVGKVAMAIAASLVPFGTFVFDAKLRREDDVGPLHA